MKNVESNRIKNEKFPFKSVESFSRKIRAQFEKHGENILRKTV